jgi:hypothetical protein
MRRRASRTAAALKFGSVDTTSHGDRGNPRGRDLSVSSDEGARITVRKILKVLSSPRLATALIHAQLSIRGKARVPLSVRLAGRVRLRGDGDVEFGQGVSLVGDVVPIEFVSYKGSRISIGDHTFITTAHQLRHTNKSRSAATVCWVITCLSSIGTSMASNSVR